MDDSRIDDDRDDAAHVDAHRTSRTHTERSTRFVRRRTRTHLTSHDRTTRVHDANDRDADARDRSATRARRRERGGP